MSTGKIIRKAPLSFPFYLGTWPWVSYPEAGWLLSPGTQSRSPHQPRCPHPGPPTCQWARQYGCRPERETGGPKRARDKTRIFPLPWPPGEIQGRHPRASWETCRLSEYRVGGQGWITASSSPYLYSGDICHAHLWELYTLGKKWERTMIYRVYALFRGAGPNILAPIRI